VAALDQLLRQVADHAGLAWNAETYDLALARELAPAERAVFVAKLMETAAQGDSHAILTLGHLQAGEALAMLQAAGKGGAPWALAARRALVLMGHGGEVIDLIARDAVHANAKMARVAAVLDLPKVGGPVALAALADALGDREAVVRMLAWNGVVEVLGLERVLRGPGGEREKTTLLELLKDFLACDLAALVAIGVTEMRAITAKLAAGATPESLGLAWIGDPAPDVSAAILQAIVDPAAAFPVAAIAKLTGVPRRWAEAAIAMRLDQAEPDPRAPDALVALGAAWAAPVLEEVAAKTSGALQAKLLAAARALRAG
jgi:hypothetical protein